MTTESSCSISVQLRKMATKMDGSVKKRCRSTSNSMEIYGFQVIVLGKRMKERQYGHALSMAYEHRLLDLRS
ncbi:hypothetical protein EVAR_100912_1 [Eumeta japonica]|uniref:Uncharacterized protein n=1 Tax=Eumeta variegata TaxID=151549 RepID=A0A4C2A792_EUMVA|nr:hypothetical protein EVAR_100912_1 [Eumeta japonica]